MATNEINFRITLDDKAMSLLTDLNENLKKLGGSSQPKKVQDKVEEKPLMSETKEAATPESAPVESKSEAKRQKVLKGEDVKTPGATIEDVRAALAQMARRNGKDSALRVLKKFDAKNASDLKSETWAAVIEACQ